MEHICIGIQVLERFVLLDQSLDVTPEWDWDGSVEDSCITIEEFREKHLSSLCSDEESHAVIDGLQLQIFATASSDFARSNITLYDNAKKPYNEYDDYGVYVKYQYQYVGKTFVVILRECRKSDNYTSLLEKNNRDDNEYDVTEEKAKPP